MYSNIFKAQHSPNLVSWCCSSSWYFNFSPWTRNLQRWIPRLAAGSVRSRKRKRRDPPLVESRESFVPNLGISWSFPALQVVSMICFFFSVDSKHNYSGCQHCVGPCGALDRRFLRFLRVFSPNLWLWTVAMEFISWRTCSWFKMVFIPNGMMFWSVDMQP